MSDKNDPVIVMARRSPVAKAFKGSFAETRPDDLAALTIQGALDDLDLDVELIEDLYLGCAMTEGEQGYNIARQIGLLAGLPEAMGATTINRFCASSAWTLAVAAGTIKGGFGECVLSAGTESMTAIPMQGLHPERYVNKRMMKMRPTFYATMGDTAEEVVKRYGITREAMDRFALSSHQKALKAQEAGRFGKEIVPITTKKGGQEITLKADEGPRRETSMEALANLKPAFDPKGQVTAGNASQMSDGASVELVTSRGFAEEHGLPVLGRIVDYAVTGVEPEVMGIGPIPAVQRLFRKTGLGPDDLTVFEINEAFASQALHCVATLEIPMEKVNVNGGAIALGHPLGATGGKLAATVLHELGRRGGGYGIETMCVGGGQGFAILFESE